MVSLLLRNNGYTVLEAINGSESLEIFNGHKDQIDLLLTDVIMPGMNGREMADQITAINTNIKVIYPSGDTDNIIVHHGILEEGINLLQKPFVPSFF